MNTLEKIIKTEKGKNIEVSEDELKKLLEIIKENAESKYSDFEKKYADITKNSVYKTAVQLEYAVKCYNEAPDIVKNVNQSLFIDVQNLAKKLKEVL